MKFDKKRLVLLVFVPMFLGMFFSYLHKAPKRSYSDFRVYYATAQRFALGEDIYARPDIDITPYKYSPMFAVLVSPLALLPIKAAAIVFFIVNFICMLLLFVLLKRIIVRQKLSFTKSLSLYALTAVFTSRFLLQVLYSGQVTIIMACSLAIALRCLEKNKNALVGAAVFALSIMFKYTSVIFLPYFVLRKKIKFTAFALLFVVLYCVIPAFYVGPDTQITYLKKWLPFISQTSLDRGSLYNYKNQSLASLVLRYFTKDDPYHRAVMQLSYSQGLILAAIIALVLYILTIIPKRGSLFSNSWDYALLFIMMALFNPNAWMHNYTFLILAYMSLVYYLFKVNFKDRLMISLVIISFILASWASESLVGNDLENFLEELSTVTMAGLVLMAALFRLKFRKEIPAIRE